MPNAPITADHTYWIDQSLTDDFAAYKTFRPEGLQFDDMIKGVGNCSYQISFSAKDFYDDPVISGADFIGPMRSFFRLRHGNVTIMAGPITSTKVVLGDDFISVAGKTWEHYLERWQYPFDPRATPQDPESHVNDYAYQKLFTGNEDVASGLDVPSGIVYGAFNRDIILIMRDIIGMTISAPNRKVMNFDSLYDMDNLSGILLESYSYARGSQTYMNSFLNDMADTGPGLDWWIEWDQVFQWETPYRFGLPSSPTIAYTVDTTTPLLDGGLGFQNDGPGATHVFGTGDGLTIDKKAGRAFGSPANQELFSRLDQSVDFGNIKNYNELAKMVKRNLSISVQPRHDMPLQMDPAAFQAATSTNFWSTFRKGRAIWIDYDLIFHHIDSIQQIVSYSASDENNSGNLLVNVSLDQRYDPDPNFGVAEG